MLDTDQTLRADTSANDVTVQLLPLDEYQGRALFVVNDNGPHNVIVNPAAGEVLFDGTTSLTVVPVQTARLTAGG
jgi:predicted 2-oxoglutarate/Fe(II)-dependent dioxygenase YbiX